MCPDRVSQRGIGLPLALFVITVLALIVAVMARLQEGSADALSLQLQSQRAFLAAESGAQLGVARVLSAGDCAAMPGSVPASGTFSAVGLQGCRAVLGCEQTGLVNGPAGAQRYFLVTSTGSCPLGAAGPVQRTVEVRLQ